MKLVRLHETFSFNIKLLRYRLDKLSEFNGMDPSVKFEIFTYFDAAMVQIRAMFLERGTKNFSFQAFLKSVGRTDLVTKIEAFFDEPFDLLGHEAKNEGKKYHSVRDVIKFITDKFICHNDVTDIWDQSLQDIYFKALTNPYNDRFLPKLFSDILKSLEEEDDVTLQE